MNCSLGSVLCCVDISIYVSVCLYVWRRRNITPHRFRGCDWLKISVSFFFFFFLYFVLFSGIEWRKMKCMRVCDGRKRQLKDREGSIGQNSKYALGSSVSIEEIRENIYFEREKSFLYVCRVFCDFEWRA